jgi:hypothetical protein
MKSPDVYAIVACGVSVLMAVLVISSLHGFFQ